MVKVPPIRVSEADLERAGTDLLIYDGWRHLKTDPVSRREWGKGFGEPGMADDLYLRYLPRYLNPYGLSKAPCDRAFCQCMWIEWKRPKAKPKPHQRIWIEQERARGALVLLADEDFPADYDGFPTWYRKSGLMRRSIV